MFDSDIDSDPTVPQEAPNYSAVELRRDLSHGVNRISRQRKIAAMIPIFIGVIAFWIVPTFAATVMLPAPSGFATSQLAFNDTFQGSDLSTTSWNPYVTSRAANGSPWNTTGSDTSGIGGAYDAEYDLPSDVTVNNGLTITATERSISGLNQGDVAQTFPWTSGAVSTYGHEEFDGGYLQVSAQNPSGDGMWPAIWLLPGPGCSCTTDNYEIDVFEGGFTGNGVSPNDNDAWHLHDPSGATYGGVTNVHTDLTASVNTYGLLWVPGKSITWYLNGTAIGTLTSAEASIPNEPMELIINLGVADAASSGFHTPYDALTPTTDTYQIDDVQMYSLTATTSAAASVTIGPLPSSSSLNLTSSTSAHGKATTTSVSKSTVTHTASTVSKAVLLTPSTGSSSGGSAQTRSSVQSVASLPAPLIQPTGAVYAAVTTATPATGLGADIRIWLIALMLIISGLIIVTGLKDNPHADGELVSA